MLQFLLEGFLISRTFLDEVATEMANMFAKLLSNVERELGIDLDGDGKVGAFTVNWDAHPPNHEYIAAQKANYSTGRVRSLFIGINYVGTSAQLRGCVNDVKTMQNVLHRQGFPLDDCRVLADDPSFPSNFGAPNRKNIMDSFHWLVAGAKPGDTLFLHYSGHGTSVPDKSGDEDDGMDEAMVPVDYQTAGVIVDDDIYGILIKGLPNGVRLTAVMDCCHSGTLLDLPLVFQATHDNLVAGKVLSKKEKRRQRYHHHDAGVAAGPDVILFSGCKDDQTSADVSNAATFDVPANDPGAAGGACSNAMAEALFHQKEIPFVQLLTVMQQSLKRRGFSQIPQLSSTKRIDLGAQFNLYGTF